MFSASPCLRGKILGSGCDSYAVAQIMAILAFVAIMAIS